MMGISAMLLTAALAASAQASGPSPGRNSESQEIVVQGERVDDSEIQQFIRAMTAGPRGIQIGQFDNGVCPAVVGLAKAQNEAVEKRMRRVAIAAGVPAAKERCNANVLVVVARDKEQAIRTLRSERPGLLWGMSGGEVAELAGTPGPAVAWHFRELSGADGLQVTQDPDRIQFSSTFNTPSRTRSTIRPQFQGSVLVVELEALAGVSTIQLADYAALRTFAQTDPARAAKAGRPTILTLMEDRSAGRGSPLSLTQWDLSFLKSLYATSNTDIDAVQRASMKQAFKRDLRRKTKTQDE
jgi:hypothetical protein